MSTTQSRPGREDGAATVAGTTTTSVDATSDTSREPQAVPPDHIVDAELLDEDGWPADGALLAAIEDFAAEQGTEADIRLSVNGTTVLRIVTGTGR